MKNYNLAFLGFGNVGRALVQLLESKRGDLRDRYGVEFAFTGVASRRLGWHANVAGYAGSDLIGDGSAFTAHSVSNKAAGPEDQTLAELRDWLAASQANVLFENTSLNPHTGQPAIDYIRTALLAGVHVVTANKGPVVYAYHELRDLAAANNVRFLFEAAVMGGAPVFSLFREALPAARLERFRGILNSTTNLILTEMERGSSFEASVRKAQDLGIAETDPNFDVDGWDATVKVGALAPAAWPPIKFWNVVINGAARCGRGLRFRLRQRERLSQAVLRVALAPTARIFPDGRGRHSGL